MKEIAITTLNREVQIWLRMNRDQRHPDPLSPLGKNPKHPVRDTATAGENDRITESSDVEPAEVQFSVIEIGI